MRDYRIVERIGTTRKHLFPFSPAKSYDICSARISGIGRSNRKNRRFFEIWSDLDVIATVTMSNGSYQITGTVRPSKADHEKDLYYASRRRKMIVGFRKGDVSSWIKKSGSLII